MRPQTVTRSGIGTSSKIKTDYQQNPFNASIKCVVTGTATYTIQGTLGDPAAGGSTWFNHPTLVNLTANATGNWAFPVRGTRINQTAGAGSVALTLIQVGQDALPEPRIIA